MIASRQNLGLTLGFIGVCMFAGTLPATRVAVQGLDPWFLTAARAAIAGFAGMALLLATRRRLPPRSLWFEIAAGALCTVIGFPLFAALAMQTVPAAHGGVVLGILPLATAVAAAVFAHERPSRGFWLLTLCGAGIVLLFVARSNENAGFAAGDIFLFGTVVSGALGYTWSGRIAAHMPGWEVISWQVAIFLPAALFATILLWPPAIGDVPAPAWAGLAYVGLVSQ
jgi:drug/metabolite transporter (DMT)-like permease